MATAPTQLKCEVALTVAPSSSIGPNGGSGTLTVTAPPECPWSVSTAANWLSGLSPASGQGPGTVQFQVAPNPLSATREGEIVVNETRLRLSQQGAACRVELRSHSVTIEGSGGSREVGVTAPGGCAWTAATDAGWISFTTPVTGSGDGSVGISASPNRSNQRRLGTVVVAGQQFTVTQEPESAGCVYVISSASQGMLPSEGGEVSAAVAVASGCTWSASSGVAWVTVRAGASGSGNGSVVFSVTANPGSARTGTVTVAGQTFTVTQAAAATDTPCAYTIGSTAVSIAATGGTGNVAVSAGAGCAWTATSNAPWLTLTAGATGTGSGSVGFSVAPNSGNARTGTITVAGRTFTVTQAAPVCAYSIDPTSLTVPAAKSKGTVAVAAGSGCAWTARSNDGWLKLSSGTSGNGNGTVAFNVDEHKGKNSRTGTLTIAGRTFTVTQRGTED